MRELEFLPAWYPQARRRRRMVMLLGWLTALLIVGMGAHLTVTDRAIRLKEATVAGLRGQLVETESQLAEMDKLEALRRQWRQQDQVLSKLGFYVEACTLVRSLDQIMPRQMSLTAMQLDNEEKAEQSAVLAAKGGDAAVERRLRVKIQGVCPTDVDLANFMTQLSAQPFFDQVNITYAREKSEGSHLMREFEVSFSLNLSGVGS